MYESLNGGQLGGSSLSGMTGGYPKGWKDQNKVNSIMKPNTNVPAWVSRKKPPRWWVCRFIEYVGGLWGRREGAWEERKAARLDRGKCWATMQSQRWKPDDPSEWSRIGLDLSASPQSLGIGHHRKRYNLGHSGAFSHHCPQRGSQLKGCLQAALPAAEGVSPLFLQDVLGGGSTVLTTGETSGLWKEEKLLSWACLLAESFPFPSSAQACWHLQAAFLKRPLELLKLPVSCFWPGQQELRIRHYKEEDGGGQVFLSSLSVLGRNLHLQPRVLAPPLRFRPSVFPASVSEAEPLGSSKSSVANTKCSNLLQRRTCCPTAGSAASSQPPAVSSCRASLAGGHAFPTTHIWWARGGVVNASSCWLDAGRSGEGPSRYGWGLV